MHKIVQLCSILLLTVATKANLPPDIALAPTNKLLSNQLMAIPPDIWARRDWVPGRDRLFDARGIPVATEEVEIVKNPKGASSIMMTANDIMSVPPDNSARRYWVPGRDRCSHVRGLPVGKGELEIVKNIHTKPKRFKYGAEQPRPMKTDKHNDLLKKHIVNNKKVKAVRRAQRPRHGKNKKINKKKNKNRVIRIRKHLDTRKSRQVVKLFPKDLSIAEEAKFKLPNDKNPLRIPLYRQVVNSLKKYKEGEEERKSVKDVDQGKRIIEVIHHHYQRIKP